MQVLELQEEHDKAFSADELDDVAALALNKSGAFDIAFPSIITGNKFIVRSKGWVGHIPVGHDLIVKVHPKVPVSTLFGMLETAYNLKSFELLSGTTNVATIEELYERVASILAHRILDRARKGLYQSYVSEQDDLVVVRGKIDVQQTLRLSMGGSPKLHCEFHTLTHDLEDNQLLLWTLYQVSRGGLQRPEVKRAVRQAYRVLMSVVTLTEKFAHDCINRFYHRLNVDYQPLHGLCRLLLEHLGPDIGAGNNLFLPFRLNMPNLFESFVAEWLRANAPTSWDVRTQHIAKLKSNAELTFRIDLLLRDKQTGTAFAVLDTKYKSDEKPTESDIQQVVAYAVETNVRRAFLVYPQSLFHPINVHIGNIEVQSLSFDIGTRLDSAGHTFLEHLKHCLEDSRPN